MSNQNHAEAVSIDEAFEPYVKRVLETHSFGVSRTRIELNYVTSSGKTKADRFNFLVPYAGQFLKWTAMFDSNCPDLGPDFEFHDDSFLSDPDTNTIEKNIPSLAHWQPSDPECLLNVLKELAQLYKQHQVEVLNTKEQRLYMEYEMMINQAGVKQEDLEVVITPNETSPIEAMFFIRLDMDFSRLPGRSNKATEDQAMLIVSFQHPNWSRVMPQLYLSLPLEATFGGPNKLHLPPFLRNWCISDYIPEVKKVIDGKIDEVAHCYNMRNSFIATVLIMHRRKVIEYDAINFTQITILLEHQDFYFLVHCHLPAGFPKDKPMVYLQSIYHMSEKKDELIKMSVTDYPYSPRWEPAMMVTKLLGKSIEKEVFTFKKMCVNNQNYR